MVIGVSTSLVLFVGWRGGSSSNGPQSSSVFNGSRGLGVGVSEQAVQQLFETVKSLCVSVAKLTNDVKNMMGLLVSQMPIPLIQLSRKPSELLLHRRLRIWKREREKRNSSIVVKGLEVPSGREIMEVFEDVWKYILGLDKVLQLSDIICIRRDKKLYRAKIEDVEIFNHFKKTEGFYI